MATRKYPYKAFVVTPAMHIKEVTIVSKGSSWSSSYDKAESGTQYSLGQLFTTRTAALDAARKHLRAQEERLAKSQENIAKRRANLAKAEAA